jgi:hypothetical protein
MKGTPEEKLECKLQTLEKREGGQGKELEG